MSKLRTVLAELEGGGRRDAHQRLRAATNSAYRQVPGSTSASSAAVTGAGLATIEHELWPLASVKARS